MTVKVRLYATLRRYMPSVELGKSVEIQVPDGATVGVLLDVLSIPRDEMRTCYVAGLYRGIEHPLQEGDDVALFPPIGGGA